MSTPALYERKLAEIAALEARLADMTVIAQDENRRRVHAEARLAEAEALLEIVAPLAYAQWKSGSCDPVETVVGLNEPITGIADSAAPAHVPDAHKCSFCAVGLVEMEYLRGKWWHIGTDTYDLCTAGVTVTAVDQQSGAQHE